MKEKIIATGKSLSALCLIALMALAPADDARAASGALMMNGSSDWKVSKIDAPSGQKDGAYCAMTRKFNKNVVLTLGSKADGEMSLAFDFQNKPFDPKKSYVIAMTIGPDVKRAFEATPASPSAIVIDAGVDESLTGALEKNTKIDISIEGDVYVFDLEPFAAGHKKLADCMVSLPGGKAVFLAKNDGKTPDVEALLRATAAKEAAAPKKEKGVPKAASSGTGGATEINALREENLRLSNALERERRSYENNQVSAAQSNLVSELREKIALLESERNVTSTKASETPDTAQKLKDAVTKLDALSVENGRLKSELERLRADANAMAANIVTPKAFDEVRAELDSLKKENETLKSQIAQAQSSGPADQVADVESITRIRTLEVKLDDAGKKIADLQRENEELRDEKERKLLRVSSDNWNLEEATRRYNEAEREIRRMASLVEENKSLCAQEKVELEGMLFDPSVTDQEQLARLSGLENKLRTAQDDLQTQRQSYEKQLEELRRANAEMSPDKVRERDEKIGALETEINAIRDELKKTVGERDSERTKVLALQKEIEGLKTNLSGKEGEAQQTISHLEGEKASTLAELERMKSEKARLETEKSTTLAELERVKKIENKNTEQAELGRLRNETARLQAALDSQSAKSAESSTTPQEKAAIGRELMALRAEIVRKDTEYNQKIQRLEAEKSQLATAFVQSQSTGARKSTPDSIMPAMQAAPAVSSEIAALRDELRKSQQAHEQEITALRDALEEKSVAQPENLAASSMAEMEPAAGPGAAAIPAAAQTPANISPVQTASLPSPAAVQSLPIPAPKSAVSSSFMNLAQISGLIENAGLRLSKPVEKVSEVSGPTFSAFRWQTGPAFGSSEQRPIGDTAEFDRYVDDYIRKTKSRCQGDFAASPAATQGEGSNRMSSYEIACVSGDAASSAAIVFFTRNGLFTVIAHEAGTDSMDVAMEDRDRIFAALSGSASSTAAR